MDLAYLYLPVYQHVDSRASGEHPVLGITLLIFVQGLQIRTLTSAEELLQLRPMWEAMCADSDYTIFQNFGLNLLAESIFADRKHLSIIGVEASYGPPIIPAV